jgi:hypothetical protein
MIRAACHCTAVRMEVDPAPRWVYDCNCSLCRRYGVLWAYYQPGQVIVVSGADAMDTYIWGDRELAFNRCRHCGCLMHHTALDSDRPRIRGVNARMMPALDPGSVRLQHTDNAHTGFFWTRTPDTFQRGEQAPVESDGWR